MEDLLKAGVDVQENYSSSHSRTALHWAAILGNDAAVRALTSAGASMDQLMQAMLHGLVPLVLMQLPTSRCLCSFPETVPYATLYFSADYGGVEACVALLRGGASVNARFKGHKPLHLACARSLPNMVQLLLNWGAGVRDELRRQHSFRDCRLPQPRY
ncbi:unnamed protein product [Laminaria digitata]